MSPRARDPSGRSSKRYAAWCALLSIALIVAGALLTRGSAHVAGVVMLGYGLGVAVAALFLAFGWSPPRRR